MRSMTSKTSMLRNALFGVFAALAVAALSPASVIISSSGVPTPGLPGYGTFTITASTNDGSPIQGFDFASLPAFGFFGPMNQVNPGGNPTIFTDVFNICFFFNNCGLNQDSHFLFQSNQLTIPGGFASENATSLRAVFARGTPFGTSVPFVQLVIPPFGTVQAVGQIQAVPTNSSPRDNNVAFSITNPFPEPSTLGLLGLSVACGLGFVRRRAGCTDDLTSVLC